MTPIIQTRPSSVPYIYINIFLLFYIQKIGPWHRCTDGTDVYGTSLKVDHLKIGATFEPRTHGTDAPMAPMFFRGPQGYVSSFILIELTRSPHELDENELVLLNGSSSFDLAVL
jgi:hypothetical protein